MSDQIKQEPSLNEQMLVRREKLDFLRERGIDITNSYVNLV